MSKKEAGNDEENDAGDDNVSDTKVDLFHDRQLRNKVQKIHSILSCRLSKLYTRYFYFNRVVFGIIMHCMPTINLSTSSIKIINKTL